MINHKKDQQKSFQYNAQQTTLCLKKRPNFETV